MRNSRNIRKFERLLFNGIPEHPESMWERNSHGHIHMRQTGHSQSEAGEDDTDGVEPPIGYFQFNFETQTEEYHSYI